MAKFAEDARKRVLRYTPYAKRPMTPQIRQNWSSRRVSYCGGFFPNPTPQSSRVRNASKDVPQPFFAPFSPPQYGTLGLGRRSDPEDRISTPCAPPQPVDPAYRSAPRSLLGPTPRRGTAFPGLTRSAQGGLMEPLPSLGSDGRKAPPRPEPHPRSSSPRCRASGPPLHSQAPLPGLFYPIG